MIRPQPPSARISLVTDVDEVRPLDLDGDIDPDPILDKQQIMAQTRLRCTRSKRGVELLVALAQYECTGCDGSMCCRLCLIRHCCICRGMLVVIQRLEVLRSTAAPRATYGVPQSTPIFRPKVV